MKLSQFIFNLGILSDLDLLLCGVPPFSKKKILEIFKI